MIKILGPFLNHGNHNTLNLKVCADWPCLAFKFEQIKFLPFFVQKIQALQHTKKMTLKQCFPSQLESSHMEYKCKKKWQMPSVPIFAAFLDFYLFLHAFACFCAFLDTISGSKLHISKFSTTGR